MASEWEDRRISNAILVILYERTSLGSHQTTSLAFYVSIPTGQTAASAAAAAKAT